MTKSKNSGSSPRKVENRYSQPPNATNVGFKPTHDWTILLENFDLSKTKIDYPLEKEKESRYAHTLNSFYSSSLMSGNVLS